MSEDTVEYAGFKWMDIFFYLGIIWVLQYLLRTLFNVVLGIRVHILSKLCRTNLVSKYGQWAVVTGCTDGIGREYVLELARRGVNVVLISRSIDKLNALATQIAHESGVNTKIVVADFSKGREVYAHIARELESLDIGILVNNVGIAPPFPLRLDEMTENMLWDHLNINMGAATMMSRIVLPGMRARDRGIVVNLSSLSAQQPIARGAVYGATKAYLEYLSAAVQVESYGTGVSVQILAPSFVRTKMVSFSSFLLSCCSCVVPPADAYAKNAVDALGLTTYTTGWIPHGIQRKMTAQLPKWVRIEVSRRLGIHFRNSYDEEQRAHGLTRISTATSLASNNNKK